MVRGAADNRTRIKGVLAKVVEPERHGIANIATFVLEARDRLCGKLVTRTLVELRNLHIFLRDRVAEGRSNVLNMEAREDCELLGFLNSERVIVTAEQNRLFELVVAHGRIVEHLVLVHNLAYIRRMDVADCDPELAIITNEAGLVSSNSFRIFISTTVVNVCIGDRNVGFICLFSHGEG